MSNDVLDPARLARITGYSFDAWSRALVIARSDGVPESALINLVNSGAWPEMIAALPQIRESVAPVIEKIKQLSVLVKPYLPPDEPHDVRGRALWLRQHRNTGPQRLDLTTRRSRAQP